jgi:hypothetical protein
LNLIEFQISVFEKMGYQIYMIMFRRKIWRGFWQKKKSAKIFRADPELMKERSKRHEAEKNAAAAM